MEKLASKKLATKRGSRSKSLGCFLFAYSIMVFAAAEVNPATTAPAKAMTEPAVAQTMNDLINSCNTCHGPQGNSQTEQIPTIAGQNKFYLFKQLQDYKKGKASGRENAIMMGVVANLSEANLAELADYFSTQKTLIGTVAPQYVTLGQKIYRAGLLDKGVPACSACHGARGEGNAQAGFPKLSGQLPAYVIASLDAYKNKQRMNDTNHIMQDIATQMSPEEITAVAHYVYGLD